jgi:hypothetical protein
VRKIATPVVMLGLALILMGAEVAAVAAADGAGPDTITQGQMTLQLTSTMPGVTFNGDTLVCPPMRVTVSSGDSPAGCEFTISSTGTVPPSSVTVTMAVSGMSPAEANAEEFAIVPRPGTMVHFQTTAQTIYSFTGAELPVTVNPGLAWGVNAGGVALGNSDLGAAFVVTYTVVAVAVEGVTASPVASGSEVVEGATGVPGGTSTPPPTASSRESSSAPSAPLFALAICFLLGGLGLIAAQAQRRSVRR